MLIFKINCFDDDCYCVFFGIKTKIFAMIFKQFQILKLLIFVLPLMELQLRLFSVLAPLLFLFLELEVRLEILMKLRIIIIIIIVKFTAPSSGSYNQFTDFFSFLIWVYLCHWINSLEVKSICPSQICKVSPVN